VLSSWSMRHIESGKYSAADVVGKAKAAFVGI
jgi:hypothetical protein